MWGRARRDTRSAGRQWVAVFAAHAVGAGAVVLLLPGGFGWDHPRTGLNRLLPAGVVAVSGVGLVAVWRRRADIWTAVAAAMTAGWAAATVAAVATFPQSSLRLAPFPLAVAAMLAARGRADLFRTIRRRSARVYLAIALGVGTGVTVPLLERAPAAGTRPAGTAVATVAAGPAPAIVALSPRLRLAAIDGRVTFGDGPYLIDLDPLLTFEARSPAGCWTIFAPGPYRRRPRRDVTGYERSGDGASVGYLDVGRSTLRVAATDAGGDVVATTELRAVVYSHLNTFAELIVAGHRSLSVAFSPCPSTRVDVLPADYPVGRPARLAYLAADDRLRVVEAASAEKGPYRELAAGPLHRGDRLTLTLYDAGRAFATVTLRDWAAQADVTPSPTAGWGLPANSILFCTEGDGPAAPATFYVTLAATGVGRGWDTVAHAAGTYSNRMSVAFEPVNHPTGKPNSRPAP